MKGIEFSEKRFIKGQVEMEQRVLLLPKIQREILGILLAGQTIKNATYLRLLYYCRLLAERTIGTGNEFARHGKKYSLAFAGPAIKCFSFLVPSRTRPNMLKSILSGLSKMDSWLQEIIINHIREKSSGEVEREIREAARKAGVKGVEFPSNKRFEKELGELVKTGYLEEVVSQEPRKTVAYAVNRKFVEEWKATRQAIRTAIKEGKIKKKWLSQASREFWIL